MIIMLMNVEVSLAISKTNYVGKKGQEAPTVFLAYKGESVEKNTWDLDIGANNHIVVSKIYLWNFMNQKVVMLLLEIHPKF